MPAVGDWLNDRLEQIESFSEPMPRGKTKPNKEHLFVCKRCLSPWPVVANVFICFCLHFPNPTPLCRIMFSLVGKAEVPFWQTLVCVFRVLGEVYAELLAGFLSLCPVATSTFCIFVAACTFCLFKDAPCCVDARSFEESF